MLMKIKYDVVISFSVGLKLLQLFLVLVFHLYIE